MVGKALIVIPTLNEEKHIQATLERILVDRAMEAAIIVAVDGGSLDGTLEIAARFEHLDSRVKLLKSQRPTPIQSASINFAVERYGDDCDWLIRIDAHAEYPQDYAANLIAKAMETMADSVVTPMESIGRTCFQRAVAAVQNSVLGTGGSAHRSKGKGGWVDHGHHALFRMAVFKKAGGYDETFSHNEDAELDQRITQLGGKIWLADDLEIKYLPRKTATALFRQYWLYGIGRARTRARHGGRPKLRQLLPLFVAPCVVIAFFGLVWPILSVPALIWSSVCLGYGAILGIKSTIRGESPCVFLSGICAMIIHFAWSAGYLRHAFQSKQSNAFQQTLEIGPC